MLGKILRKIFKSRNDRILRSLNKDINKINLLEPQIRELTDDQLKAKTEEFKARFQKGETLSDLLPEAFAVVLDTSVRCAGGT